MRSFIAPATLIAAMLAATPLAAHEYESGALSVAHPWSRATAPTAKTGALYFIVENKGDADDRLIAVTVDPSVAAATEMHGTTMDGDVMRMRPEPDGLPIPAHGTLILAPGGYHVMLLGLASPLAEGARIPATLVFEGAGPVAVEIAVEAAGAVSEGHDVH
jgi:copper(I)-binding protein